MDMNWNQLQYRLSELLIWERVLRTTDMRQSMNAANLEKNLKEQAEIDAAIQDWKAQRRAECHINPNCSI
ncbi:hypothetical protein [Gorillibacterium timonense]|uniref:hypothetical protein n=1 Tax=Gorillibacterium timonense TaxID=1689269 RepID=UPI0011DE2C10|nr:hypothetical protein [Gorillibacterium timonense]